MLEKLTARLNSDENEKVMKSVILEATSFQKNNVILDNLVKKYSDDELKSFTEAINLIDTDKTIPVEMNNENYSRAFNDTATVISESVVSTEKTISISKEDYMEMLSNLKKFDKLEEDEKKKVIKRIKSFLSAINKELRKANDDHPADAMIIALINKLCKIYNVEIVEDNFTAKYILATKINKLSKAIK